ncbi:hypothetical protein LGL08_20680 [Clostridium estertheticum]|uniref:hypothetical protein n=1 Tax=Clostridium estertheticum TaxID=238834 RepID=UPI001CF5BFC1|nr:hypothetical protein [Clostridium estertheticum]MCB2308875.1 hypothetical protein [Clostridium estertheticum]MCB2347287.1 hypothetical protein [Clostridium estertheticum]MCB2351946.1 hypothetical protein [Clostridium estertheticum]WAG48489.1 hypothetical protein LL127_23500 [Clostridium estertheticum]
MEKSEEKGKSKRTEYNQAWESKNRKYASYLKSRSSCKSFIRNHATTEDLEAIEQMIRERKIVLIDEDENNYENIAKE